MQSDSPTVETPFLSRPSLDGRFADFCFLQEGEFSTINHSKVFAKDGRWALGIEHLFLVAG